MTINKISEADIESLKVASLPSRPTAPTAFGGAGYTAKEMKGAFDRLPLYIISKINALIDSISEPSGIIDSIPSGISDGHTLKDLTRDILSGTFATYQTVLGAPLADKILNITKEIADLKLLVGTLNSGSSDAKAALGELTSRLSDIEGNVAAISRSIEEINADLEAAEAKASAAIEEAISALTADLDNCRDILTDRIDYIDGRLEGVFDLEIDCGGPGNL